MLEHEPGNGIREGMMHGDRSEVCEVCEVELLKEKTVTLPRTRVTIRQRIIP